MTCNVFGGTLNPTLLYSTILMDNTLEDEDTSAAKIVPECVDPA